MDERLKNAFLELLRSGIWGIQPDKVYFSDFTETDWFVIHDIVCKQAVIAICLEAVCRLPEGYRPPSSLLLKWIGQGRYIEAQNRKIAEIWAELNEKFSTEGIYPVILKGLSFANNYSNPLSRQAGDLDLLIPNQFEKAVALVRKWGYQLESTFQHDSFCYKGITIELHPRINSFECDCSLPCNTMIRRWERVPIRTLDVNLECLLLLVHAAKHLMVTGIGYRLLCDWATFLKKNHQKLDFKLLFDEFKRIGIHNFVIEFTNLVYLELNFIIDELTFCRRYSKVKYSKCLSKKLFYFGDFAGIYTRTISLSTIQEKIEFYISQRLNCWYYWPRAFWKYILMYLGKMFFLKVRKMYRQVLRTTPHRT